MMNLISKTVRIKHKLIMINLFTTGVALLLAGAVLIMHEFVSSRDSLLSSITAQAKIIGSNSAAPLIFNDQRAAGETLSALKASPNIVYAAVYAKDGSVFVEYWRADSKKDFSLPAPGEDGYSFADNHLNIFQSIILDREKIGTIYIRSDLEKLYSLTIRHGVTAIIAIAFAFGIAIVLLSKLQKQITKPILHLAELMQSVSQNKNYSLKARIFSEDEIGSLAKGFNEMLEQIQERDMKLQIELTEHKRTGEELWESQERYRALVDNTMLGIAVIDTNYRIIMVNPTIAKLFKKSASDFAGKYCFREFEKREAVCQHCPGTWAMVSGKTEEVETQGVQDDGNRFYVHNRAAPFFGSDGILRGFIEMVEDIDARKLAEKALKASEKKYRTLIENLPQKIFYKDNNSIYLSCNENYARDLKIGSDKITGKTDYDFFPKELAEKYRTDDKRIMESGVIEDIEEKYIQEGRELFVNIIKTPVKDERDNIIGVLGIFWDITERKQAEEDIRKLNEQLEQKVEERTKQLFEAQEELVRKKKLAILGQLAGSVGHELRNPFGVINNAIYFLKTIMPDADETVKEYLNIINDEVLTSERIVSDLLDFARTKTPQKSLVTVGELITQSLKKCKVPENVTVEADIPETLPEVIVDPMQMGQVFQNLITNGIQAMPEGGELRVTARSTRDEGRETGDEGVLRLSEQSERSSSVSREQGGLPSSIEISVTDTGEGIKPENMAMLFQPLYTTKARGIGLGLTVSKSLTEANGGRLEAASHLGKGTTFTVILPVERETT